MDVVPVQATFVLVSSWKSILLLANKVLLHFEEKYMLIVGRQKFIQNKDLWA